MKNSTKLKIVCCGYSNVSVLDNNGAAYAQLGQGIQEWTK